MAGRHGLILARHGQFTHCRCRWGQTGVILTAPPRLLCISSRLQKNVTCKNHPNAPDVAFLSVTQQPLMQMIQSERDTEPVPAEGRPGRHHGHQAAAHPGLQTHQHHASPPVPRQGWEGVRHSVQTPDPGAGRDKQECVGMVWGGEGGVTRPPRTRHINTQMHCVASSKFQQETAVP